MYTRHERDMRGRSTNDINNWGGTVNPLAYAFVGSSPTSPTIPGEAEVGLGKTHDLVRRPTTVPGAGVAQW